MAPNQADHRTERVTGTVVVAMAKGFDDSVYPSVVTTTLSS